MIPLSHLHLFSTVATDCIKAGFFGLRPWYYYLPDDNFDGCTVRHFHVLGSNSDFPLVLLAVVDDLLRIAALVAIGFVLYGSIQMITSQGSPDGATKARTTIINAVLGLAIAIVSVAFVSYLGSKLGG